MQIVVKVALNGAKSRSKAMKIAVGVPGVESVGLGGEDESQREMTGDGVDAVVLTTLLRKKCGAELISVSVEGEKQKEEEKRDEGPIVQAYPYVWPYVVGYPVYELRDNHNSCNIM